MTFVYFVLLNVLALFIMHIKNMADVLITLTYGTLSEQNIVKLKNFSLLLYSSRSMSYHVEAFYVFFVAEHKMRL